MRDSLRMQLTGLTGELSDMATVVAQAMLDATAALLDCRVRLAERVIAGDPALDARRDAVEARAVAVLALQQPVATDLRRIVSVIKVADDLERMGDLAEHVAKVARLRHPEHVVPAEIRPLLARMGDTAIALARKAALVVGTGNVLLARELDDDDEAMDDLHREVLEALMDPAWEHGVAAAVDITLLARFYERYADHAVSVAERTIYAVMGEEPVVDDEALLNDGV